MISCSLGLRRLQFSQSNVTQYAGILEEIIDDVNQTILKSRLSSVKAVTHHGRDQKNNTKMRSRVVRHKQPHGPPMLCYTVRSIPDSLLCCTGTRFSQRDWLNYLFVWRQQKKKTFFRCVMFVFGVKVIIRKTTIRKNMSKTRPVCNGLKAFMFSYGLLA